MGINLFRRLIGVPVLIGIAIFSFQNCQPNQYGSSGSHLEFSTQVNASNGFPYDGLTYSLKAATNVCADGTNLLSRIIADKQVALLIRDDCQDLNPGQTLNPSSYSFDPTNSAILIYRGQQYLTDQPVAASPTPTPSPTPAVAINYVLGSNDFTGSHWSTIAAGLTANAAVSPDGSTDATYLYEDNTTNYHYLGTNGSLAYAANTSVTYSVFAKAGTRNFAWIQVQDVATYSDQIGIVVNLSTGALADSYTNGSGVLKGTSVTSVGNGWYRLSVSGIVSTTHSGVEADIEVLSNGNRSQYAGGGSSNGLYIFGAQLESGTLATGYVPTGN
ncbi:MAG: hypothetical protein C5B49_16230 [Bdellovibrio sp.]|nr:MAG: hypothetical protein C5B49_16230 [Bdellovibrio sp.]